MQDAQRLRELEMRIAELEEANAELRADNDALRRLSRRDGLTDLLNRRGGLEEWQRICHEAMRRAEPLSIVFLDLIAFKAINDGHGQPAGDRVLQAVGRVLLQTTRPADVVCRPGGDEFVVILPRTDAAGCVATIARMDAGLRGMSVRLNDNRLNGVQARYAHATELSPTSSPPHHLWDDVGTRIKADKSHDD